MAQVARATSLYIYALNIGFVFIEAKRRPTFRQINTKKKIVNQLSDVKNVVVKFLFWVNAEEVTRTFLH